LLGQIIYEGLDGVAAGFTQSSGAAIVSGIGFDEFGIELMLTDQKAQTVPEAGLTVTVAYGCGDLGLTR
jgi:hypothetical protein